MCKKILVTVGLIALFIGFTGCEVPFEMPFELPFDVPFVSDGDGNGGGEAATNQGGTGAAQGGAAQGGGTVGGQDAQGGTAASERGTPREVVPASRARVPRTGDETQTQGGATLDTSNISSGYFMVHFEGNVPRFVVRVEHGSAQQPCDFFMGPDTWQTIPLTHGNGTYTVTLLAQRDGGMFAVLLTTTIEVSMTSQLLPFLYPNIFVNFTPQTRAVQEAARLAEGAYNELDVVQAVYDFVVASIAYDHAFAEAVTAGTITEYIPDLDDILRRGTGVCFDYAAVMTAMLRAQNIPTRLEIGFVTGGIFHAWVTIHTPEHGWVGVVQFAQGNNWTLMDPTFTAANDPSQALAQFIGDGSNYQTVFRR